MAKIEAEKAAAAEAKEKKSTASSGDAEDRRRISIKAFQKCLGHDPGEEVSKCLAISQSYDSQGRKLKGTFGKSSAPTPLGFVGGIAIVAFGCVCLPALQAFLSSLAAADERGALLGALGSLTELTSAIGSTMYASLLAHFTSPEASLKVPGMHFLVAAALLLVAFAIGAGTLPPS